MRMTNQAAAFAAIFLVGSLHVPGQTVANRITEEVNANISVALPGTVKPQAVAEYDRGHMNTSKRIAGITLYIQPSAKQKTELDTLVMAQQTPGTALYLKWITPQEYTRLFGVSDNDLAKVESWLQQ